VRLTRLPYSVGCLIAAVVAGGPGSFLVFYLGSFSLEDAWSKTVSVSVLSIYPISQQVPVPQGVVEVSVSTLALFVDMYLTGYLRRKVLASEPMLSPLSPGGETAYRRAFGLVASTIGSLFFTLVFFFLYFPARAMITSGPVSLLGMVILTSIANAIYGAAFWVYLSSLWGVYRFGRERLNLKRFYEDRMLGLRPLGQLVVSSALTFSGAITITLGASLITGEVSSIAINLAIVALGVAMLFLPLRGIHRRMVEVKEEEEGTLSSRSKELLTTVKNEGTGNGKSLSEIEELVELQRFQVLRAEASRISEWPFETRSAERLIAILLAIFTVLLARLLQVVA
jgi:hypothetical protein